ncbi:MAG: hypothetical protein V2A63_00920 [Patescibacteria group bacterium]
MGKESFSSAAQNMFETGSLQQEACRFLRGKTRELIGHAFKTTAKLALAAVL